MPEERGLYQKMKWATSYFFAACTGSTLRPDQHGWGIGWNGSASQTARTAGWRNSAAGINRSAGDHGAPARADLALLDEPFTGLDPINSEFLADALRSLRDSGKTVVLSSHRLEQVEDLCDNIAIIARGRLRLAGGVAEVRDKAVRRIVNVRTASGSVRGVEELPAPPSGVGP